MPLISCEVSLVLKWNKNCVITSLEERQVDAGPPAVNGSPTDATLAINDCKLYVPVVTLSKDDEIRLLTNLKSGFTREIIWNKYRPQMSTEAINNNLNILIDLTFTNVNRLFVLAYQVDNNNNDDRQSFSEFYLPRAMGKDYNVIIDKLAFFDLPIKNEEEAYKKIIDISRNNEYTTGNSLDYDYFKKYYKLIAIDLSKQQVLQENEDLMQQINFNNTNNTNYGVNKDTGAKNPDNVKYYTRVLKPNLCDYADAYILVDGTIRGTGGNGNTRLALKNCAPFTECNLEINDEHADAAEDIDIVIPMYNLIEYSDNYQDSSATLYQYKRDEPAEANAINDLTVNTSSSFKYKVTLLSNGNVVGGIVKLNVKVVVPLKYLSNFF